MTQLKERLCVCECCIQSPWHPSLLIQTPPLLLLRFLLLPAICMYLHDFYDVHILCSDCMVMQKKASLSSAITQPTESYLDII